MGVERSYLLLPIESLVEIMAVQRLSKSAVLYREIGCVLHNWFSSFQFLYLNGVAEE